jgi:uncharacterized membrane protein
VKSKLLHKLIQPGRIIFALGIIALGVLQFITSDYIITRPRPLEWPAWAAALPGKAVWAWISGSLLIIAALAVLMNKRAWLAAVFIGAFILVCSFLLRHLTAMTDWVASYKALALGGGAFIVAASFPKKDNLNPGNSFENELILTGCIFLSLFFLICGIAHFKFDDFVKDLVPAYIGNRYIWTYFAAVALLAGGIGIIIKQTRKWAALLSGVMVLLWFVMLHIPRAINIPPYSSTPHYGEWMGVFESFSFSGIFFVLAGQSSKEKLSTDSERPGVLQ